MKSLQIMVAMGLLMAGSAHAAAPQVIEVVLKDHTFTPNRIEVPANTPVVLHVKNNDATPAEFESDALKVEKIIAGNSSAKVRIAAVKAGEYPFFDEFHQSVATGVLVAK